MAKRKKNRSGRAVVEARKRRFQGGDIRYRCLECGIEEDIPRSVVEMFDALDDDGDLSVAPRFDCEKCGGTMEPLEYEGVHGVIYKISEDSTWLDDEETIF